MKEKENIASYLLCVDKIFNAIKGIGEKVEELMIVQMVLRSLPLRFDAKFPAIEEMKYLDSSTMDGFHGIIMTYEIMTNKQNT